jgi:hypothetical protein
VNETLNHYKCGGSNCHIVSLDAAKAFDKLWRDGLFFKLIPWTEAVVWRLLYHYYAMSYVAVDVDGCRSDVFKISEGVKQGGVLSSALFNFFMDALLEKLLNLNVGAIIGDVNTSAIAYCDDFSLMSPVEGHIQLLLDECSTYAEDWKLSFNPSKSSWYCLKNSEYVFKLSGRPIPKSDGFIYLGLPVGDLKYVENFYSARMTKCERAFYSLKSIGCSPFKLHPYAIGFVYKQFCQSILKFGFEYVYLRSSFLDQLNVRQNLLLKNVIGIKHRARFKPLINELKVEPVGLAYGNHKVFGWKQCVNNPITNKIFNYIYPIVNLNYNVYNNFSFNRQISEVIGGKELSHRNVKLINDEFSSGYICNDVDMKESIVSALRMFYTNETHECINQLNTILKIEF